MHPLEAMQNPPVTIEIHGHVIEVRELTMAGLPAFAAAVEPFMEAFDEASDLPAAAKDQVLARNTALFRLLAQHSDAFIRAAEVVTNANGEFYRKLPPDEFFKVAALIVERNAAFFVQRLAPSLVKFAANLGLVGTMFSASLQTQDSKPKNS